MSRKKPNETAVPNKTYVSWSNTTKGGRITGDCTHSSRIHKAKTRDGPQSMPIPQLGHFTKTIQLQAWIGVLPELTCCIFPMGVVQGA